ncbi:hypothetical protein [Ornithinimicrobium kibberense]|uniref:hypothetical protein n=1 Tax=Ornithinimicrobium kibberense TaxID=282060 RepID=UPI0036186D6A
MVPCPRARLDRRVGRQLHEVHPAGAGPDQLVPVRGLLGGGVAQRHGANPSRRPGRGRHPGRGGHGGRGAPPAGMRAPSSTVGMPAARLSRRARPAPRHHRRRGRSPPAGCPAPRPAWAAR